MKTTRAFLFVLLALAAPSAAAFVLLNLSLPAAAFFEYGAGTLFTVGLATMFLLGEGTTRRPEHSAPTVEPPARPRRSYRPARHLVAHAA